MLTFCSPLLTDTGLETFPLERVFVCMDLFAEILDINELLLMEEEVAALIPLSLFVLKVDPGTMATFGDAELSAVGFKPRTAVFAFGAKELSPVFNPYLANGGVDIVCDMRLSSSLSRQLLIIDDCRVFAYWMG